MRTDALLMLSGAAGCSAIPVDATSEPGRVIHTSHPSAFVEDQLTLYASNASAEEVMILLDWGAGSLDADSLLVQFVPPFAEACPLAHGVVSGDGVRPRVVRAFVDQPNAVTVFGSGNRFGAVVTTH